MAVLAVRVVNMVGVVIISLAQQCISAHMYTHNQTDYIVPEEEAPLFSKGRSRKGRSRKGTEQR